MSVPWQCGRVCRHLWSEGKQCNHGYNPSPILDSESRVCSTGGMDATSPSPSADTPTLAPPGSSTQDQVAADLLVGLSTYLLTSRHKLATEWEAAARPVPFTADPTTLAEGPSYRAYRQWLWREHKLAYKSMYRLPTDPALYVRYAALTIELDRTSP